MHLLRAQLQCACFDLTARYGRWLYGLKLCRVRRIQNADGAIFFQKTRFRRSRILVGAGNLFLKLSGGDLFGLSERQWLGWEQKMAPISSRQCVRVRGRSLLTPLIAGESLAQILASTNFDTTQKKRAVALAAQELRRLQRLVIEFPDGGSRAWSHGDAHAKNVMVDLNRGRAIWFDFETVHSPRSTDFWRHADDFRALSFSCAAFCRDGDADDFWIAEALANAIECRSVRAELARQSARLLRRPRVFPLAQAPLNWQRHQHFGRALQKRLTQVAPYGACE